jgi:MYXO-CTERM domain-containing protein
MSDASGNSGDAKVAALRQEIAQTRADLGETVEALAAKADVKARAHELAEDTKARARELADEAKAKARQKAAHAADSGRELVRELRTEPAAPARRAVHRVRASMRDNPKPWAVTGAALLAFALLVVRRRRIDRANRFSTPWKES